MGRKSRNKINQDTDVKEKNIINFEDCEETEITEQEEQDIEDETSLEYNIFFMRNDIRKYCEENYLNLCEKLTKEKLHNFIFKIIDENKV